MISVSECRLFCLTIESRAFTVTKLIRERKRGRIDFSENRLPAGNRLRSLIIVDSIVVSLVERRRMWVRLPRLARFVLPVSGAAIAVFAVLYWHYGSLSAMAAHRSGYVLYARNTGSASVSVRCGSTARTSFLIQNLAWVPVTIHGASMACACTTVHELPLNFEPGQKQELVLEVKTSKRDAGRTIVGESLLYTYPLGKEVVLRLEVVVEPAGD